MCTRKQISVTWSSSYCLQQWDEHGLFVAACGTGARPTYNISIEFEIQWNFTMLSCITYSTDHKQIVNTPRRYHSLEVHKIALWSVQHVVNHNLPNCDLISNSIEVPLVGQAPGLWLDLFRFPSRGLDTISPNEAIADSGTRGLFSAVVL